MWSDSPLSPSLVCLFEFVCFVLLKPSAALCSAMYMQQVYGTTFIAEGKAVFNVEYKTDMSVCDASNDLKMDTIIKVNINCNAAS